MQTMGNVAIYILLYIIYIRNGLTCIGHNIKPMEPNLIISIRGKKTTCLN